MGKPITDFHVDRHVICDILDKLEAGERLAEYAARLRCKDGSIKHVLIDSSVMWRDGQFIRTRCFTRDVTARKETETALAHARSQLDAAEAGFGHHPVKRPDPSAVIRLVESLSLTSA